MGFIEHPLSGRIVSMEELRAIQKRARAEREHEEFLAEMERWWRRHWEEEGVPEDLISQRLEELREDLEWMREWAKRDAAP